MVISKAGKNGSMTEKYKSKLQYKINRRKEEARSIASNQARWHFMRLNLMSAADAFQRSMNLIAANMSILAKISKKKLKHERK